VISKELKLYSPHSKQLEFHNSQARYRVVSFGRQSGKSTACLNELIAKAWNNPNTSYWFISPTFDQARVQYRRLIGTLWECNAVLLKNNQTELRVKFINQSQIRFVSGEQGQNLRGETLHGVVIDEYREQPQDLWGMVVRPMITTTGGWAAMVSTPNGFDAFYDLAKHAQEDTTGQWAFLSAESICNPLFTLDEYTRLRTEMSEALFAQEIRAEFRDLTRGKVYYNFSQANVTPHCPWNIGERYSPLLPIIVGMDFNVGVIAWTLMQARGDDFYIFDEISITNTNTQEAIETLIGRYGKHEAGFTIIGDATGNANKTSAVGQTDYTIIERALRLAGIQFRNLTPTSNPLVKDRVNIVNSRLKDANGDIHLRVHPECKRLTKDLERVVWKQGADKAILDQVTDKTLTHASDAMGYVVAALSRSYRTPVSGLKVIHRI